MNSKGKNIKTDYKVRTPTSYIKLKTKALGRLRLFLLYMKNTRLREIETTTYTHRRTRGLTKVIERVLLTKARFIGSMQVLFNLPRSLKMSPISHVWYSLLLCMFALMVLKSQHGKKNILVILTHLVGNIKALICHVRASPTEAQHAAL